MQDEKAMEEAVKKILTYQKNEITEHILYGALAGRFKGRNAEILRKISQDELRHYNYFKKITGQETRPGYLKIYFYRFVSLIFGITFVMKMMSNGEDRAEQNYEKIED